MSDNKGVIVDVLRTPFAKASVPGSGKPPGMFHDVRPVDLTVPLINQMLQRTGLDPADVSKVLTGAVHQEYTQGLNTARLNVLADECGLSHTTAGTSVDMFCASSMETIAMADAFIARNPDDVYICTGVQSMSQIPMGGFNTDIPPQVHEGNAAGFLEMGITAENLAKRYNISRHEQDAFAIESHRRAADAQNAGRFDGEILPLYGLDHDNGVRKDSSIEDLAKLKPSFKAAESGGTVTPATSSQVTDGAAAIIVTSEAFAQQHNLPVKAQILATGETGVEPEIMGIGPVEASEAALKKAGLSLNDMAYIELNEAFAAQSLAVLQEFDNRGSSVEYHRVNPNGGAIAMGHPLGASGARLVGHLAHTLQRTGTRYGLATLCVGGGQGKAVILKNPAAKPA